MPIESNKASNEATVRRYLEEAIDRANVDALDDLCTPGVVLHHPGVSQPVSGLAAVKRFMAGGGKLYGHIATAIHDVIAEGDRVACRLSHRAAYRADWRSRIGTHPTAGQTISWDVIAIFRFEEGKIAEQWVCRDELGMLLQLGAVGPARKSQ